MGSARRSHLLNTLVFDQLQGEAIGVPEDIVDIIGELPNRLAEGPRIAYSSRDAGDEARFVFLYYDEGTFHVGECTLGGKGTIQWEAGLVMFMPQDIPASVARKVGEGVGPALALTREDAGSFDVLRRLADLHFMASSASQRVSDTMDLLILTPRPQCPGPWLRELSLHGKSSEIRSASDAWIGERMRVL